MRRHDEANRIVENYLQTGLPHHLPPRELAYLIERETGYKTISDNQLVSLAKQANFPVSEFLFPNSRHRINQLFHGPYGYYFKRDFFELLPKGHIREWRKRRDAAKIGLTNKCLWCRKPCKEFFCSKECDEKGEIFWKDFDRLKVFVEYKYYLKKATEIDDVCDFK